MSVNRFLTFNVCDDFRVEVGNKFSLIGCYTGAILVHPIPSVIPKLCVLATAYTPVDRPFSKLVVRVMRGEHPVAELPFAPEALRVPGPLPDGALRHSLLAVLVMSPFPVEAAERLRVEAETEEGIIAGGSIWIDHAVVPPAPHIPELAS